MKRRLSDRRGDRGKRIDLHSVASADGDGLPPAFAFDRMRSGYTLDDCRAHGFAEHLVEAIWRRCALTWRGLLLSSHWGNGFEHVPQSKVTNDGIPGMTPDQKLLVLRFANKDGRIVGYREGRIYHVLWVDTDLSLYDHGS